MSAGAVRRSGQWLCHPSWGIRPLSSLGHPAPVVESDLPRTWHELSDEQQDRTLRTGWNRLCRWLLAQPSLEVFVEAIYLEDMRALPDISWASDRTGIAPLTRVLATSLIDVNPRQIVIRDGDRTLVHVLEGWDTVILNADDATATRAYGQRDDSGAEEEEASWTCPGHPGSPLR